LTPRIVGQAENAHRPVLDRVLLATGTSMSQWVALVMTAESGEGLGRDELARQIASALKVNGITAEGAITELTTAHLLTGASSASTHVQITQAGRARYQQIRTGVDEVVTRAYRDIPTEDLQSAARVLALITERLDAETALTDSSDAPGSDDAASYGTATRT
jgi:DNA-binding MarR family transcriptional regulator